MKKLYAAATAMSLILCGCGREPQPVQSEVTETDKFPAISVDSKVMEVNIKTAEKYEVSCSWTENYKPEYSVSDGVLNITQKNDTKLLSGSEQKCSMTITIPQDAELESLTVSANVGDTQIQNINCSSMKYKGNVGTLEITGSDFDTINADTDISNVELNKCEFKKLSVNSNIGNTEINSDTDLSDYNMDIECKMGSIEINDSDMKNNYVQKGTVENSIEIKSDTGSVEINY